MNEWMMLAQRGANSPANVWLRENPLVLGLLALLLGVVLAGSGAYELRKGVAHDKYGNVIPGGMGQLMSIIRIVFGIVVCLFGLYKIVAG